MTQNKIIKKGDPGYPDDDILPPATDNLDIWNKLKQPPKRALKEITGGRLKGMTDINPQWRYEAITEQFGCCGVGWKYEVSKYWLEPASDGQVVAFAEVLFFYNIGIVGEKRWSDPVPGIGGSMFITKEKSGLHTSDEAYKMAVTDALSVALKMIGVAADIYAGRWDEKAKSYREDDVPISNDQFLTINALIEEVQADEARFCKFMKIPSIDHMPTHMYDRAVNELERKRK